MFRNAFYMLSSCDLEPVASFNVSMRNCYESCCLTFLCTFRAHSQTFSGNAYFLFACAKLRKSEVIFQLYINAMSTCDNDRTLSECVIPATREIAPRANEFEETHANELEN